MSKYKRRRKKNKTLLVGIILISVLILIGTGYSLWSENLYIEGTANINYKEPKIDRVTINKTDGEYFSFEDSTSSALKFVKNITGTTVADGDEKLEIIGNFEVRGYNVAKRDVKFNVSFTNNYPVTITNGQAELIENTTKYNITTSQTETILPNQAGTFSIIVTLKANSTISTGTIKYKLSYKEGEITKYLYVTINLT